MNNEVLCASCTSQGWMFFFSLPLPRWCALFNYCSILPVLEEWQDGLGGLRPSLFTCMLERLAFACWIRIQAPIMDKSCMRASLPLFTIYVSNCIAWCPNEVSLLFVHLPWLVLRLQLLMNSQVFCACCIS